MASHTSTKHVGVMRTVAVRWLFWGSVWAFALLGVRHYASVGWAAVLLAFWLFAGLWIAQRYTKNRADLLWRLVRAGDSEARNEYEDLDPGRLAD